MRELECLPPYAIFGDPLYHDWHVTLTTPMFAWWKKYPDVESGRIIVPAEVGEVLCAAGAAKPNCVSDSFHPSWFNLPWKTND